MINFIVLRFQFLHFSQCKFFVSILCEYLINFFNEFYFSFDKHSDILSDLDL